MTTATPFLWFDDDLQEAVEFYRSVFPDVEILSVQENQGDWFGCEFTVAGTAFMGLNGGPGHPHTDAFSIFVACDGQAEVDRYWDALVDGGGSPTACGWIDDRFGVSWQIIPRRLHELLADPDPARAKRALDEMMRQVKIDVAALERAADGE